MSKDRKLVVAKFGGTSLADAAQIRKSCDIVLRDPARRIMVVSAPGKRNKTDTKVTDLLIACAEQVLAGRPHEKALEAIVARYAEIEHDLGMGGDIAATVRADLLKRIAAAREYGEGFMDCMKAAGEDNCAKLVAAALRKGGHDAHYIDPKSAGMILGGGYGQAYVLQESYGHLKSLAEAPGISVFPGFFGYTQEGRVITFPRGGSDITGAIVAAAVNADVYENFTDVDSVFVCDPRVVPGAKPVAVLTYAEMRELSYAGFGVFHDEAIAPAVDAHIPICIKNTNAPDKPGTLIVPERPSAEIEVVGISSDEGFCTIFVSKYLMNRAVGFGRRLLQVFEEEGIPFEHLPTGIDNVSVILRESYFNEATEHRVLTRLRTELQVDSAFVERGLALVMIVGEGMRNHIGIAARATRALADAGTSIEMMSQGASELSMMFGVKKEHRTKAVTSLYQEFFGRK